MKWLLFTAAMWCYAAASLAQNQPPNSYQIEGLSEFEPSVSPASVSGLSAEEYDIEIARLPKLAVFTDSQEGFKKIVEDYPMARQINVLDAHGEPIYRYLPSDWEAASDVPDWPKGVYLIELYLESERKISSQRLVIL